MLRIDAQAGDPLTLRYHVVKADGTALVPADVATIKLFVYLTDTNTESTPTGGTTMNTASTVLAQAQPWDLDATGFNVVLTVPGTYLSTVGVSRVEVLVTPAGGTFLPFYLEHVEATITGTLSLGGV